MNETRLIMSGDKFNFDYMHVIPDHRGGCSSAHGHSSTIALTVTGLVDEERHWVVDFGEIKRVVLNVINELDHRFIVCKNYMYAQTEGSYQVRWRSIYGTFDLVAPKERVVLLDTDPTVEALSAWVVHHVVEQLPENVRSVNVIMNEGVGKAAEVVWDMSTAEDV